MNLMIVIRVLGVIGENVDQHNSSALLPPLRFGQPFREYVLEVLDEKDGLLTSRKFVGFTGLLTYKWALRSQKRMDSYNVTPDVSGRNGEVDQNTVAGT